MLATTTWSIPVWFRGYFYELVSEINPRLLLMVISQTAIQPAHWRQVHFRPEKALPLDATHRGRRMSSRLPFPRTIVDFFVSFLCLGIPYFFIERSNVFRADEESGLRGVVPKLVIWASTCLVVSETCTIFGLLLHRLYIIYA